MRNLFCEIILNLDQWLRRKGCLNFISYLELWWLFPAAKQNHFCNFRRWIHVEHFCEIILNLDQWFRRICHFKGFLSRLLAHLMFGGAGTFVQFW